MTRNQSQTRRDRGVMSWLAGNVVGAGVTVVGIAFGLAGGHTMTVVVTGLVISYGSLVGLLVAATLDRRARKIDRGLAA